MGDRALTGAAGRARGDESERPGLRSPPPKPHQKTTMVAIHIENLGKYFGSPMSIEGAAAGDGSQALLRILGFHPKPAPTEGILRTAIIAGWVLRDVSLDIEEGAVVFLVGASGSGKTVFLRILAGAMGPTTGRIELRGSVSSLLGIGDNIDTSLTAYENIESYRTLLRREGPSASHYAREVISFAELEGFEDVPVRTYSTGMIMRLSVALALHGSPSILLLDDVLNVGDIAFRQKCAERLRELKAAKCTMVLVSSDEGLIQQLGSQVITFGSGRVVAGDAAAQAVAHRNIRGAIDVEWQVASHFPENDVVALHSVSMSARGAPDEPSLLLSMEFGLKAVPIRFRPLIDVMQGTTVLFRSLYPEDLEMHEAGRMPFTVEVPAHILSEGRKRVTISAVAMHNGAIYSLKAHDAASFTVRRVSVAGEQDVSVPLIEIGLPWEIESVTSKDA